MANRTIFSDSELIQIEKIVADLKVDGRSVLKIQNTAHEFFINKAQDSRAACNLTTEACVNAVVQFAAAAGYEIKKKG